MAFLLIIGSLTNLENGNIGKRMPGQVIWSPDSQFLVNSVENDQFDDETKLIFENIVTGDVRLFRGN